MIPISVYNNKENDRNVGYNYVRYNRGSQLTQNMPRNQKVSILGSIPIYGVQCHPSISSSFHSAKDNDENVPVRTFTSKTNYVSPNYSFIPLRKNSASSLDKAKCAVRTEGGFSPITPQDLMKLSPTPSARTIDTLESYESFHTFQSSGYDSEEESSSPLSYKYTAGSNSSSMGKNYESSSLSNALLHSPQNELYCRPVNSDKPLYGPCYSPNDFRPNSPTNRKSPFCQRSNEQDPNRKCRAKTELCLHYINKGQCPFGENCTYAHGEEELQFKNLLGLHDAGLIDVSTYRTVPCLTFVCTGSW